MLLLATAMLAFAMLHSVSNLRKPDPCVLEYRGELQSAELIHAARFYWSSQVYSMEYLLNILYELAEESKIYLPPVSFTNNFTLMGGRYGYGSYSTAYNNSVFFEADWKWKFKGYYVKELRGEKLLYRSYILEYYHNYTAPQWGVMVIYPFLEDPAGVADILYERNGSWRVGFPARYGEYCLVDEYGLRVVIKD